MTDLLKYQALCPVVPEERAQRLAAELEREESLTLVRHPDDEVNPNAVAVYHDKVPIAWIPPDILDEIALCLDKGMIADTSVMRVQLEDSGLARAVEVLIFLEPPAPKEPKVAPKRRLAADEKDRSDLIAGAWVALGAVIVIGLILFFLYWMLIRPALEQTARVDWTRTLVTGSFSSGDGRISRIES